ncbi:MAG: hypothetical protein ACXW32_10190, partial [Limisphaerales bacterium]
MGTPEDSSDPFEDIEERLCQLYQTHVAPRWSQAAVNCALAKVLLQFSIGLQRQLSLLGNEYTCIDMGTTTMCVLFNNCLQEIRECCEAGNKGSTKIAEILGVVRQDALMGENCISESDAQEAFDICSSNVWTGTYSVQAIGYTNITHSDAFSTRVHIDDFVSTFTGSVIESTESGSPANGYIVQLRVAGEITVSDFSMDSTDFKTECGSRYRIVSSRIVAAAPTQYTVTLSTRPDGSYVVSSFNRT